MIEFLDEREKQYLLEIKHNIIWKKILQKIIDQSRTPRFKPKKGDQSKGDQSLDWVYESGRLDEREAIISLLRMEEVK